MLLRCTIRFLDELGSRESEITNFKSQTHPLDEWYAHIFYLQRRKCAMFMNAKTRFSFVVMDIKRKALKPLEDVFRKGLARALYEEGYSAQVIKMYSDRVKSIRISFTEDRSVLGSINQFIKDLYFIYEHHAKGNRLYDGPEIGQELRRTPVLKHGFPDQNMKELLASVENTS
jgi:hypothetical protein